jgi:hypothetical protein
MSNAFATKALSDSLTPWSSAKWKLQSALSLLKHAKIRTRVYVESHWCSQRRRWTRSPRYNSSSGQNVRKYDFGAIRQWLKACEKEHGVSVWCEKDQVWEFVKGDPAWDSLPSDESECETNVDRDVISNYGGFNGLKSTINRVGVDSFVGLGEIGHTPGKGKARSI